MNELVNEMATVFRSVMLLIIYHLEITTDI